MTGQTGTKSSFNARADAAASVLLDDLRKQGRDVQGRKVQIDADGQPAKPLPPEGSYLRQQIERQRAEAAAQQPPQLQRATDAVEPEGDVGLEPSQPNGTPAAEAESDLLSEHARRRFAQVTSQLRESQRELDQERAERRRESDELKAIREQLDELKRERETVLAQNLEQLDPEVRVQTLLETKLERALRDQERRIKADIAPQLEGLRERSIESDLMRLSEKYSRFDVEIHGPLIEQFRRKNPNCSIEQAFRAIAEPDEIVTRPMRAHVPPVVEPGSGPNAARNVPAPQRNPEDDMVSDARKAAELMRSTDPNDHREGVRLYERNIAARYARRLNS